MVVESVAVNMLTEVEKKFVVYRFVKVAEVIVAFDAIIVSVFVVLALVVEA